MSNAKHDRVWVVITFIVDVSVLMFAAVFFWWYSWTLGNDWLAFVYALASIVSGVLAIGSIRQFRNANQEKLKE